MSDVFAFKHFSIHQEHAAMKVGTDSDLLGVLAADTVLNARSTISNVKDYCH